MAGLENRYADIVSAIRKVILQAAPEAKESIKWAQPVYESNGPFVYIKAFKSTVNFGFWRGIEISDPKGILQGSGGKMRHVKLANVADVDEEAFTDFVRQAVELNRTKGNPAKGN
ncbi:DUF1801 domain-containing protein [Chloroflexota bacterium]